MHDLEALVGGLVSKIIKEYSGFNLDRDDLVSEGYLIATEKMEDFRPDKGACMRTYLYSQVNGRLRNYVNRQVMKASHGTEEMRRVSMEHVDNEVCYEIEKDTKILLDEFKLSLETREEQEVFDYLRCGYSYREISDALGKSIGSISNLVKRWGASYYETA